MEYRKVIETNAIPGGLRLNEPGFIFMQVNGPKIVLKLHNKEKKLRGPKKHLSPEILSQLKFYGIDQLDKEVQKKFPTMKESL